jgi:hypothetical protein
VAVFRVEAAVLPEHARGRGGVLQGGRLEW